MEGLTIISNKVQMERFYPPFWYNLLRGEPLPRQGDSCIYEISVFPSLPKTCDFDLTGFCNGKPIYDFKVDITAPIYNIDAG